MMTVNQVSKLTGVSIRTLQYYDTIGLLNASAYTQAGYRLYDDTALQRLQQILLLRELEFPLKDIQQILARPDHDRQAALRQQIALLEMKKAHVENLITLAREMYRTGEKYMDFSAFDKSKMEAYAQQAKRSWGNTEAYQEFQTKSQGRSAAAEDALGKELMEFFVQMGQIKDQSPASPEAQTLVKKLQSYITEHYYRCTDQILLSLGQMYAAGGEFTENIDAAGGEGTALFANEAIRIYCA